MCDQFCMTNLIRLFSLNYLSDMQCGMIYVLVGVRVMGCGVKTKQFSGMFSLGIDLEMVLVRIAFDSLEEP